MKLRVDRGRALAPGFGSLLRAFGSWGRPAGGLPVKDRRKEPRLTNVECAAKVGWKVWGESKVTNALVVDISRSGARVFLDRIPPGNRPVWVSLETPGDKRVVKARVLTARRVGGSQYLTRVEFKEPCPYAFFEAAVCGLAPTDPKARPARPRPGPVSTPKSVG